MAIRLPIPKLAYVVAPLRVAPIIKSELLLSPAKTWAQDVVYLRETYDQIHLLWDKLQAPEQDRDLYEQTEPKLRELVLGLEDVSEQLSARKDVYRDVANARHDFDIATIYGKAGDFSTATVYQSYSLLKLHNLLDALTAEANKMFGGKRGARHQPENVRIQNLLKDHYRRMKELHGAGDDGGGRFKASLPRVVAVAYGSPRRAHSHA